MSDTPELTQEVQDIPELDMTKYEAPTPAELYTAKVVAEVDLARSSLEALTKEAEGLTIAGIEDKDGYAKVQGVLTKLTKSRTRIDMVLKAARDPFNNAAKQIKALFDKIEEAYKKIEAPLSAEKAKIDGEKKRLAEEKAAAERARVLGIQKSFADYGVFKSLEEVAVLSDEEVATQVAAAKETFEKAQADQKAKDDELSRLRAENASLKSSAPAQPSVPASEGGVRLPSDVEAIHAMADRIEAALVLPVNLVGDGSNRFYADMKIAFGKGIKMLREFQ